MLDDLGQHLTPEIIDGSAASTLFNDIKHKPLQMGLFPKKWEIFAGHLPLIVAIIYFCHLESCNHKDISSYNKGHHISTTNLNYNP